VEKGRVIRLNPSLSFHFNLSNINGRIDNPVNLAANAGKVTTVEFVTIMSSPYLKAKTTFYVRSGTIYKPTTPFTPKK